MSKCENCIHYEVCNGALLYPKAELNCSHYKDKSLCVELPCKVGQKVWEILYGIDPELKATKPYISVSRIEGFELKEELTVETSCSVYYREHIGELLFLTKEEAEKKLKEIEG